MIEGSIERDVILNGTNSLAVANEKGIIYRFEPIPIIQEINLHNIERNRTKIFKLNDHLTKDYEILGVVIDIPEDDGDVDEPANSPGQQTQVNLGIRIFQGKKAVDNVQLRLTSYPTYTNKLFINHRDTWHMRASRDIARITFKCRSVYMEQPIVFP